jgi:hypothetical protein
MTERPMLLPCPFCGASMDILTNKDWHRMSDKHDDDCPMSGFDIAVPATEAGWHELVRQWNRRATIAQKEPREEIPPCPFDDLTLRWHKPADYEEAVEMLRRARRDINKLTTPPSGVREGMLLAAANEALTALNMGLGQQDAEYDDAVKQAIKARDMLVDALRAEAEKLPQSHVGASLLHPPGELPPGCYCPPDKCYAPVIMGRQTPCRRAAQEEKK